jgi:MGT family glycosyltransferase
MIALSKELATRGHRVTLFLPPQFEQKVRVNGLDFVPIAAPKDTECLRTRPELNGTDGWSQSTRARLTRIDREIGDFLAEYLPAIRDAGVDALIMDEIVFAGPTVAEIIGLPYVVLSTSIPHNFGWDVPLSYPIDSSWQARLQRKMLEVSIFCMRGPIRICLDHHRQRLGLSGINKIAHAHPHIAHITQWPECLDSPRPDLPASFYYTGPFATSRRTEEIEFPWDHLDDRPLVYASLGTTRKAEPSLFYQIAEACAQLDVQLVITLGGERDSAYFTDMPGDPILVQVAPQLELLSRAEVVVTHAGPNTVLETLLHGKPMVALPLTLDQPAVADRISRIGAAEVLPLEQRSSADIRTRLLKVLGTSSYREAAEALEKQLTTLKGVSRAVRIIESALDGRSFSESRGSASQTIHQSV